MPADFTPRKTTTQAGIDSRYDQGLRRQLADAILKTIANESLVADAAVMAIRTGETLDALADILVTIMAMVPTFDTPSELRQAAENLSKRLRREVAQARAEGVADEILGARKGGCA